MTVAEREWIRAHLRDLEDAEDWLMRTHSYDDPGLCWGDRGLATQPEFLAEVIEIEDLCGQARDRLRQLKQQEWNQLPLVERRHRAKAARKRFHGYLRDAKRRTGVC